MSEARQLEGSGGMFPRKILDFRLFLGQPRSNYNGYYLGNRERHAET